MIVGYLSKFFAIYRWAWLKVTNPRSIKLSKVFFVGKNTTVLARSGVINFSGKAYLHDNTTIKSFGDLTIGTNFSINPYSRIVCFDKITIGENVLIAQFVSILDHDHSMRYINGNLDFRGDHLTSEINIGNNVWIGDKVTILKGVNIGNNVVIAANCVVNKDIPNDCIVGGIPCNIIKKLKTKS